jgi:DNA polymerase-3 subunit delta'
MASEMLGHGWALEVLRRHLKSGTTRHAYLVTGPEGVGRSTLMSWFAQALLCSPEDGADPPCGRCESCRLVKKHTHPDLYWLKGDGGLKVDDVRSLQHNLALSPYQARRRVAALPDFETATTGAANALLKTLEEPPPNVVLLLTAASEESLLSTIVSRCEVLALRPMGIGELTLALQSRGESAERAQSLAGQAMGRPGLAIRLIENPDEVRDRSLLIEDGLRLLSLSRADRFEYASDINHHKEPADNRQATLRVLETWLGLWRDVLHRVHSVDGPLAYPEVNLEIEKVAARVEPGKVEILLRDIETAMRHISSNANPLLALETVLLALPTISLA